jgi:hypothetical protein
MSAFAVRVVCLNWKNYLGRGAEYVEKLGSMVFRHLTVPHYFVEVTERDLPQGRSGWFNKLHLLEMFDGPVLYLDLDIVITGNIDAIVEAGQSDPSRIWARDDWSYPVTNPRVGREATINSSVMFWTGRKDMTGATPLIPVTHGDQGIITQLFWPDGIGLLEPSLVKSFKYDYLQGKGFGPITVFHGKPKPHEVMGEGWIDLAWK